MIPSTAIIVFNLFVIVSMILCFARMKLGPSAADRMVAIDLLGLLVALLMISHAIQLADESILDVVLIFSMIAFFGTVALARYIQRESDEQVKK